MKNIYFISESIPHNGYGSFIIFYRHLLKLKANGYKIFLIVPEYQNFESSYYFNDINNHFNILKVPFNKWWYPPYRYRNILLRYIRFLLIYNIIKKDLINNPPDFIISYFYGNFLNGFAVFLKKIFNCKIGTFLHDDKSLLNLDYNKKLKRYDQYICKNASVIWTVSKKLKIENCDKKHILLYPIPKGDISIIEHNNSILSTGKLIVGFSGSIYESYFRLFQILARVLNRINGELHIITTNVQEAEKELYGYNNIKFIKSFKYNADAMDYLKNNCSILFCGYPDTIKEMPWIVSSFPSKFVEYTHLGLPIILSGPKGTALSDWVEENKWLLYTNEINEDTITELLTNLKVPDFWLKMALQSKRTAIGIFNADKIHNIFEDSIKINLKINFR